ncbi:hypothetical protein ACQ4LE_002482 [Meloidogyne hapla]
MSNYSVYLVQPNLGQVSQPFYQPPLLEALSSQEAILSTLLDRRSSARRPTTTKETKPSTSTAPQEPIVRDPNLFSANELRSHLLPVCKNCGTPNLNAYLSVYLSIRSS